MTGLRPSILLYLRVGRRRHRPRVEVAGPAVVGDVRGHEPRRANEPAIGPAGPRGMPGREDGRTRSPVPLDGEVDVTLRLGGLEQERSKGVVSDEWLAERIYMVLGVLGEESDPGVAVEGLSRGAVGLEPDTRLRVSGHPSVSSRSRSRS